MGLYFCFFSFLHFVLWLSLFHLTLAHLNHSTQSLCHGDERSALLQFKESIVINKSASSAPSAYPKVALWNTEEENGDCCSWDGVKCNEITGHVIMLDLTSSCLYGSINSGSSLFRLVHLEWLSFADNDFCLSKIPSGIKNLSRLSHLDLDYSGFSGQIPSEILELSNLISLGLSYNHLEFHKPDLRGLANLSSLTYLSLENCYLQGEFPAKIFQLPKHHFLSVSNNENLTGYLPEFQKGNPLERLTLYDTGFTGEIPNSIGNLKSLVSLRIGNSYFSGPIPSSLGDLDSLEKLFLYRNNFSNQNSGSLSWISKLDQLTYLELSYVNLVGEIPSWVMNLTRLTTFRMDGNQLTGPIPYWLMNMHQLTTISLRDNQLTGHIPSQIGNLTQLTYLCLGLNQLGGPIPSSISDLDNLEMLDLRSNNLSGKLDLELFLLRLKSLDILMLSSNNLSVFTDSTVTTRFQKFWALGLRSCNLHKFPNFLQNQDKLQVLDLSSNMIAGQIPGWLLNVSADSLRVLNLSHNLLTGFDQYPIIFPRSSTLDLCYNKFQGPLPVPSMSTFSSLISNNQLSGEIPPSICSLNDLQTLDLSHNNLSGILPCYLGNFSNQLSVLNLEGNKFHGSIPDTFINGANLRMIDLSNNLLQGRIPRSLVNCTMLEFLDLGGNQIIDNFPFGLGTLQELKVLVLKSNRFYGVVEKPMIDSEFPKLRIIDLSHNRFIGNLPLKSFQCWNAMKVVNASPLTYMQDKLQSVYLPISTDAVYFTYSITLSNVIP